VTGIPFFCLTTGEPHEVSFVELFEEYRAEWRWHLANDTGRVSEFPASLELLQLGTFAATGGYELRALAVRDASGCSFIGQIAGWSEGFEPPV
jgi:hypothetical protein